MLENEKWGFGTKVGILGQFGGKNGEFGVKMGIWDKNGDFFEIKNGDFG